MTPLPCHSINNTPHTLQLTRVFFSPSSVILIYPPLPSPNTHVVFFCFCLIGTFGQANNATWSGNGNGGHNDDYDGYDDGDNDGGDYGEDFCDADNDGLDNDHRGGVTVIEPERVGLFINTDALLRAPRLGDTPLVTPLIRPSPYTPRDTLCDTPRIKHSPYTPS